MEGALIQVLIFWMLTTPHEYAHAWVAMKLGDDTPVQEGRVTLNPNAQPQTRARTTEQQQAELRNEKQSQADSLRAQAHESANRLHAIVTMVELGQFGAAVEFATAELQLSQALIDRLALCVGKACEFGLPGCRKAAEHALRDLACAGTRDAHDADAAAAGGGGNSGDRLADYLIAWHGQACRD